jgi:hypothetical protein
LAIDTFNKIGPLSKNFPTDKNYADTHQRDNDVLSMAIIQRLLVKGLAQVFPDT